MTKLSAKERDQFRSILNEDFKAIDRKFYTQIHEFWDIARKEVMKNKGWDHLEEEKEQCKKEIDELEQRIHEIEQELSSDKLTKEQIVKYGGRANSYGKYNNARFFDIDIDNQLDFEVAEFLKENMDLKLPAKILRDISRAALRSLTMCGTFEEARATYEKFYALDFRKYGVDIPPRLEDVRLDTQAISDAQKALDQSLIVERKLLEKFNVEKSKNIMGYQ